MDRITANRWISNHVIALTAVLFYVVHIHLLQIPISPTNLLPAYGLTYVGYHFIRKLDDKVSHETSWITNVSLLASFLCIIPLFFHLPNQMLKWIMAGLSLVASALYIFPIWKFRLRNYALTKSITIALTWVALFYFFLLPEPYLPPLDSQPRIYCFTIGLLLVSCWAYDIQESEWSASKIKQIKIIIQLALIILFFVHPLDIGIKKGMVGLLLLLYALHIKKLQKFYHPRQNVWIDIFFGLNLLTLLL